jgi:hypothetical protein
MDLIEKVCEANSTLSPSYYLEAVLQLVRAVLFVAAMISSTAYSWWMWTPGDTVDDSTQSKIGVGYHPDQPIPYSHELHAGQYKMPCEYCHSGVRRSATASIPPINTCMACHKFVATDKDSIKAIKEKYDKNEPIEWVKVHDLPDHVRFSHRAHWQAKVECAECHGDMTKAGTAAQHAPLQMGWCIGCHTERKASNNCITCHY